MVVLHGQQRAGSRRDLSGHYTTAEIELSWNHLDVGWLIDSTALRGDVLVGTPHSEFAVSLLPSQFRSMFKANVTGVAELTFL
jgi:hypothetical protein